MVLKLPHRRLIKNLPELETFAADLAKFIKAQSLPFYVLLIGDLGAGKTTLTRYLLRSFGIKGVITSPTFIILNQYHTGNMTVNHMDAYRLSNGEDLSQYEELFQDSLNIVEWPDKLGIDWSRLPHIKISIKQLKQSTRLLEME